MTTRRRIVVATADRLANRMAGPAIRAWNMAAALAREHDVELVSIVSPCELVSATFPVRFLTDGQLRDVVDWCDILITQGSVTYMHPFILRSDKVVVIDLYDPMHLETLEQSRDRGVQGRMADVYHQSLVLNEQLARGDFFLAAFAKQRDFWLGGLAAAGRINPHTYDTDRTMYSLIDVVPFGLSDEPPEHRSAAMKGVVDGIGPDDKVVLWGGGIYNWFDPITLIRAIHLVRRTVPEVRLYFLGLQHPNPGVPAMSRVSETIALASRLGLVGSHVFFNDGWVPYTERANYLLEADVGVSTHFDHVETAFSFRTRLLDYLWAGLPIVTTAGDYFADLVATERLGAAVPAGDVESLARALSDLLTDGQLAKEARSRSLEVSRRFIWAEAMRPLLEFCRNPARAPDLVDTEQAELLGVGFTPKRPPKGAIDNLHLVLDHWAAGGPRLVVSKIASRLRSSAKSTTSG